jgi:hypothetical protein
MQNINNEVFGFLYKQPWEWWRWRQDWCSHWRIAAWEILREKHQ